MGTTQCMLNLEMVKMFFTVNGNTCCRVNQSMNICSSPGEHSEYALNINLLQSHLQSNLLNILQHHPLNCLQNKNNDIQNYTLNHLHYNELNNLQPMSMLTE